MSTVAVLGAGGYVGAALVAALAAGDPRAGGPAGTGGAAPGRPRVRAVSRRPAPVPPGVTALTADLTAPGELARAVAGADAVVNLAASIAGPATWRVGDDDGSARVNVELAAELVRLLAAAPGRPVLLGAGSTSQAGVPARALDGTEPDDPRTPYDRQKLATERLLLAERGVRGISLRLPTVVGRSPAGAGRGVLAAMVRRALAGEPLVLWGDGAVRRDFLDVTDAAAGFAAALRHADRLAGRHWVLGSGTGTPLRAAFGAVAAEVAAATGAARVPLRSVPPPDVATVVDRHSTVVDPRAFRARTGWAAAVPLAESVRRMVRAEIPSILESR